ncbi:hypothetical protein BDV96DRAFT_674381 [Lophiotrema nucula]|uniref:TRUD domain-containing protein n=1 Tax=Lophiotrema nucula TaxID=690887 RepID=A0A6A5ZKG7_9PLEO|nr:hypothetical protein BDV96DRAFT_674381 [Lophiotrema nucula]
MADLADTEPRPAKRARLDDPSSAATSAVLSAHASQLTPVAPAEASKATTTVNGTGEDGDLAREVRAGITEYVSPDNAGFSGVLKHRYTDFMVNEILPNGEVLHLKSVGLPPKAKKEKTSNSAKQQEEAIEQEQPAGTDVKALDANGEEQALNPSEAQLKTLHAIFGESTTEGIIKLVRSVRKHPDWKAKEFKAVIATPITDKEARTQAHRCLREIFPNMLESGMEPDQSIRIKARPPLERGNKRGRGREERPAVDGRKGKLPWDELGGEYVHFTLYKENKDTMEVVGFLGSITKSGPKGFGFAGTKDRRACTVQRVSVKRQTPERLAHIGKQLFNAAIGDFEYQRRDLGLGDLLGNQFVITLKDCHFENEEGLDHSQRRKLANEVLRKSVRDFSEKGFINYYGLQRFGSFSSTTDNVGIKLLQEDFKGAIEDLLSYSDSALAAAKSTEDNPAVLVSRDDKGRAQALHMWKTKQDGNGALNMLPRRFTAERNVIQHLSSRNSKTRQYDRLKDYKGALLTIPRTLRMMYVHAYQSLVWNVVAGKRWTLFGDKVVEGDLVLVNEHKDKQPSAPSTKQETIDQDGEVIINPAGDDSAIKEEEMFERARHLTKEEAESGKYSIFDVVLPQPGFDVEYPKNEIGEFYEEFMGSEKGGGLNPHKMRRSWKEISLSGAYRKLLARPLKALDFEVYEYVKDDQQFVETDLQKVLKQRGPSKSADDNDGKMEIDVGEAATKQPKKIAVVVQFQLSSSQYATIALRELMKAGGVKAFKPEYMGGSKHVRPGFILHNPSKQQAECMPSAALGGLWPNHDHPQHGRSRHYRQVNNTDMKAVKYILGHFPFPYPADPVKEKQYWDAIRRAIRDLPSHLRESRLHAMGNSENNGVVKQGKLCNDHKGMSSEPVYDIWAWVKEELDHKIGPFLHPILVKVGLTPVQEKKVRQLEPVLQLYHKEFDTAAMTPEGREPIVSGNWEADTFINRWAYQKNECPACILARIGSDEKVLFALYAGMVGYLSESKLGKKNKPKSSRLRWIKYLLGQHEHGEKLASEAWDLGEEMRRTYRSYKEHRRYTGQFDFYGRRNRTSVDSRPKSEPRAGLSTPLGTSYTSQRGDENTFTDPRPQAAEPLQAPTAAEPYTPPSNPYQWSSPPPAAPSSLYAHRDQAASSIYSRTTGGSTRSYRADSPVPYIPTMSTSLPGNSYARPASHQSSRNRSNNFHVSGPQQGMATHISLASDVSTIASEPEPIIPNIHNVRRNILKNSMSRGPSVHSQRAEADNVSLTPSAHPSMMPRPLHSGHSSEGLSVPRARPGSMYSGMGNPMHDYGGSDDEYAESAPGTPATATRGVSGAQATRTGTGASDARASVRTNSTRFNFF